MNTTERYIPPERKFQFNHRKYWLKNGYVYVRTQGKVPKWRKLSENHVFFLTVHMGRKGY